MKTTISGIQWMAFMLAGSIVAPIAIGDLYGLDLLQKAGLVQRTLFVLGVASLLQGFFGHKLPINEGPAGLWWGVFTIYAGLSTTLFTSATETLRALEGAMLASGLVFIGLSLANLVHKLAKLFTPVVLGVYLLLLVLQLSGSFVNGMLGVGYRQERVDLGITLFSVLLVLFTFYLSKHKNKFISQFSILISITIGWLLFYVLGFMNPAHYKVNHLFQLPEFLPFGAPIFDAGMITTTVFVTLLLLTNMIASIQVVESVTRSPGKSEQEHISRFKRAGLVSGINQLLGGGFSAIGSVPISGAAGFIATTNITKMVPFLIGSIITILASFSPHLMSLFATLPPPVGYSVMFVVFANMISMAFSQFDQEKDQNRIRFVIGISLLGGVGAMFVPAAAFEGIPPLLTSILNNGLILGSIIAIIADQMTIKMSHSKESSSN
jgi:xanthine/uracil permease